MLMDGYLGQCSFHSGLWMLALDPMMRHLASIVRRRGPEVNDDRSI